MSYFNKLVFCFSFLLVAASPLIGAEEASTKANDVAHQSNMIVASLATLVLIKFTIAGTLGYLWYRNSKYKKQKVILDV